MTSSDDRAEFDPALRNALDIIEASSCHMETINTIGGCAIAGSLSGAVGVALEISSHVNAATIDFMPVPRLGIVGGLLTVAASGIALAWEHFHHRNIIKKL